MCCLFCSHVSLCVALFQTAHEEAGVKQPVVDQWAGEDEDDEAVLDSWDAEPEEKPKKDENQAAAPEKKKAITKRALQKKEEEEKRLADKLVRTSNERCFARATALFVHYFANLAFSFELSSFRISVSSAFSQGFVTQFPSTRSPFPLAVFRICKALLGCCVFVMRAENANGGWGSNAS
jgi:hypothetical protein